MTGWRKDEELAVVKAGNNAMSAIYTIAECSSFTRLHYMVKRHRNFRETFLRNYAEFQLQHPDWPKRTEQSLLSKYDEISRKIRKDCGNFDSIRTLAKVSVEGSNDGVSCKLLLPKFEILEEMTTPALLDHVREMRINMKKLNEKKEHANAMYTAVLRVTAKAELWHGDDESRPDSEPDAP